MENKKNKCDYKRKYLKYKKKYFDFKLGGRFGIKSVIDYTDLNNVYAQYDNIDENILIRLKNEYWKSVGEYVEGVNEYLYPLVEFTIKNNKLHVTEENIKAFDAKKDQRLQDVMDLIKKTIAHYGDVPNTRMYIWISDRFPWYIKPEEFPIYVFARPKNALFPIFPDNTFANLSIDVKYGKKQMDWNEIKKLINDNCSDKDFNSKMDKIYFKGADTTKRIHKIRSKLAKYGKKKDHILPLDIHLDAFTNYEPIYSFCNYKYLLNLPGHYPWSNRLKYLFLMKSIVINVNVKIVSIDSTYNDDVYITFIDYVVTPDDYNDIIFTYYKTRDRSKTAIAEKMNVDEFNKFIKSLTRLYKDIVENPTKYVKTMERAYDKINNLGNIDVYEYIYNAIKLNSKILQ